MREKSDLSIKIREDIRFERGRLKGLLIRNSLLTAVFAALAALFILFLISRNIHGLSRFATRIVMMPFSIFLMLMANGLRRVIYILIFLRRLRKMEKDIDTYSDAELEAFVAKLR